MCTCAVYVCRKNKNEKVVVTDLNEKVVVVVWRRVDAQSLLSSVLKCLEYLHGDKHEWFAKNLHTRHAEKEKPSFLFFSFVVCDDMRSRRPHVIRTRRPHEVSQTIVIDMRPRRPLSSK